MKILIVWSFHSGIVTVIHCSFYEAFYDNWLAWRSGSMRGASSSTSIRSIQPSPPAPPAWNPEIRAKTAQNWFQNAKLEIFVQFFWSVSFCAMKLWLAFRTSQWVYLWTYGEFFSLRYRFPWFSWHFGEIRRIFHQKSLKINEISRFSCEPSVKIREKYEK